MKETLAIRIDPENPNHHLWKNGNTWAIHYTVHTDDGRKRRVRYSLRTRDLEQARVLRDAVFAAWSDEHERPLRPTQLPALALVDDPPEYGSPAPKPKARLLTRHPRIELAECYDGLAIPCQAPDTTSAPRLARIDRGMNMIGTLIDDFYVVRDVGWGHAASLILWVSIDASQMDDHLGRIAPLARVPLEDFYDEERGAVDMAAAGAHLMYAWIRHAVESFWEMEQWQHVEGGDLLDDAAVEHVVEAAFSNEPLNLRGRIPNEEQ